MKSIFKKNDIKIEYKKYKNKDNKTVFEARVSPSSGFSFDTMIKNHSKYNVSYKVLAGWNFERNLESSIYNLVGKCIYDKSDEYIPGLGQKIARKRLLAKLNKTIIRYLLDYAKALKQEAENAYNIIQYMEEKDTYYEKNIKKILNVPKQRREVK